MGKKVRFENDKLKMYHKLAPWWHLLSPPEDYADEAEFIRQSFEEYGDGTIKRVLELGCGGGNNAYHLKQHYELTLTDVSEPMLKECQRINPECPIICVDMRELRLPHQFDAVFVHDAIEYMTTEQDLKKVFKVVYGHLRPGGVGLFMPDHIKDTFKPATEHGGKGVCAI